MSARSDKSRASAARRRHAMRDTGIPPLAQPHARKGKAPQKVGLYGRTSMYYKTTVTIDSRWSHTRKDHDA